MKEHRSCGKPPERAAHLEGPRHDDPVDKAVKRTAEKKREGFHPAVVSMGAMSAVRGMTAPGVKKPFKENEKDNDRQGALPHPFGISPRREGFGEKMPERNAQQQPAGERHEGVPEAAAPPEGEPGRSGERQKARQQVGRKDFKHGESSEKKTCSPTRESERNSLYVGSTPFGVDRLRKENETRGLFVGTDLSKERPLRHGAVI